jgi:hypothetical protein
MREWISVDEQLPEKSGFVWLYLPDKENRDTNNPPYQMLGWFISRKTSFVTPDGAEGLNPSHWMEIPEPPIPLEAR